MVLRTSCSLPLVYHLPQSRMENMRFQELHVLFLSHTTSYKVQQRMCGLGNHTFSASHMLRQDREYEVLRTTCSLPVVYHLSQTTTENVWFFKPHILCLSYTVSHRHNRRHKVPRTTHSLLVAYHFPQSMIENVWFEEPHILCLSYTVSCETGQTFCPKSFASESQLSKHISGCSKKTSSKVSLPSGDIKAYRDSSNQWLCYCGLSNYTKQYSFANTLQQHVRRNLEAGEVIQWKVTLIAYIIQIDIKWCYRIQLYLQVPWNLEISQFVFFLCF